MRVIHITVKTKETQRLRIWSMLSPFVVTKKIPSIMELPLNVDPMFGNGPFNKIICYPDNLTTETFLACASCLAARAADPPETVRRLDVSRTCENRAVKQQTCVCSLFLCLLYVVPAFAQQSRICRRPSTLSSCSIWLRMKAQRPDDWSKLRRLRLHKKNRSLWHLSLCCLQLLRMTAEHELADLSLDSPPAVETSTCNVGEAFRFTAPSPDVDGCDRETLSSD